MEIYEGYLLFAVLYNRSYNENFAVIFSISTCKRNENFVD